MEIDRKKLKRLKWELYREMCQLPAGQLTAREFEWKAQLGSDADVKQTLETFIKLGEQKPKMKVPAEKYLPRDQREGTVLKIGALSMQLCVPAAWTRKQILKLAEQKNPAGTRGGWCICRKGDTALAGCPPRVQCADAPDRVHVVVVV